MEKRKTGWEWRRGENSKLREENSIEKIIRRRSVLEKRGRMRKFPVREKRKSQEGRGGTPWSTRWRRDRGTQTGERSGSILLAGKHSCYQSPKYNFINVIRNTCMEPLLELTVRLENSRNSHWVKEVASAIDSQQIKLRCICWLVTDSLEKKTEKHSTH